MWTRWTILQRGVLVLAVVNFTWALAGLIANPSFATGDGLSGTSVLGVDYNGWHAVSGLLVFAPGFVLCRRDDWSRLYALAMIPAIAGPGLWALFDHSPLGIWPFAHNVGDAVLHFAVAGCFAVLLLVSRPAPRTAAA